MSQLPPGHGSETSSAAAAGLGGAGALTFEVELRKPQGARLGIDVVLVSSPRGCGLVVENISPGGVVEMWNRRSQEPMRIHPGDFIIRVNGVEGDINALAAELRSGKDVIITVKRASPEEGPPQTWKDLHASMVRKRQGPEAAPVAYPTQAVQRLQAPALHAPGVSMTPLALPAPPPPPPGPPPPQALSFAGAPPGPDGLLTRLANRVPAPRVPTAPRALTEGVDVSLGAGGPPGAEACGGGGAGFLPVAPGLAGQGGPAEVDDKFTFEALLAKPDGARLGIDVLPTTFADITGLAVKRISKGGVVDAWNQMNREQYTIRPGDCIVRVNGLTSEFPQMMEELRVRRELRVTVVRRTGMFGSLMAPPAQQQPPPPQQQQQPQPAMAPTRPCGAPLGPPGGLMPGQHAGAMAAPVTLPPPLALLGGAPTGPGGLAEPARHPMSDVMVAPRAAGQPPLVTPMGVRAEYKPLYFDVELQKPPNSRLGIDVMLVTGGSLCGLFVERVAEGGCMDQWNRQSRHPRVVMPGDFIVQVNGIGTQNLQRMAEEFARDSRQVCFSIQRNTQPRVPEPGLAPAAAVAAAAAGPPPTRLLFDTKAQARPPPQQQPFSAAPNLQQALPPKALPPNAHAPGLRVPSTLAKAVAGLPVPGTDGGEAGAPLPAEDAAFVIDGQRIDRGRASCTPVAPIGAGRSSAPAPTPAPVEAERAPEVARPAVRPREPSKEAPAKKDTQPPAKLLQSTLQLGDKELSDLLRAALKERPRLITPISEALGALIG